jgi:cholesterol transport system auxiliary component
MITSRSKPRAVLAFGLALSALGCGLFRREYPERQQFVLAATPPQPADPPAEAPVLGVRRFRASPLLAGTNFVYRTGDQTFESDFYNVFWTPPAAMVAEATGRWLRASGLFSSVVEAGSITPRAYALEGAIAELYGDYRDPGKPTAVMGLRFALEDVQGREPRILFHKDYSVSRPIAEGTPTALAAGWNQALGEILSALETDLRTTLRP